MPDQFGSLQFPVQYPDVKAGDTVTDPRLDKISNYLQAVLNADAGKAWGAVSAGRKFVEQVFTNDPNDSVFNEKDLPALFVFDPRSTSNQMTDDLVEDVSTLTVLWVPQNAEQSKRSFRSNAANGFKKVVQKNLYVGRHPAWFDPGDPDEDALTRGSVLITRAGLCKWPFIQSAQSVPVTIVTDSGSRTYQAFALTMVVSEITEWDPGSYSPTSKVDTTMTAGALNLEFVIPPVTP